MVGEAARFPAPAFTLPRLDGGESRWLPGRASTSVLLLFAAPILLAVPSAAPKMAVEQLPRHAHDRNLSAIGGQRLTAAG